MMCCQMRVLQRIAQMRIVSAFFFVEEACCTLDFNFGPLDKSVLTSLFHPLWLNHQARTPTESIQDLK